MPLFHSVPRFHWMLFKIPEDGSLHPSKILGRTDPISWKECYSPSLRVVWKRKKGVSSDPPRYRNNDIFDTYLTKKLWELNIPSKLEGSGNICATSLDESRRKANKSILKK